MGQGLQQIKLLEGMNVDIRPQDIRPSESRYNLNLERSVNIKGQVIGGNSGNNTPHPSNVAGTFEQPEGVNTTLYVFEAKKTNENYVFVHNSLGNHHIYRVNSDHSTQMVLMDPLLNFSLDPKYSPHGRVYLYFNHNSFLETGNRIFRKYLVWTVGNNRQGFLDVETSIATNGFRVPYFNTTDRTQLWELATRPSLKCPTGEFLPVDPEDEEDFNATNFFKEKVIQVRIMYYYTDGRPTTFGPISQSFVLETFPCQKDAQGIPRCVKLTLDAGGPHVERVVLAFRTCPGNFTTVQDPEWFETATIEKYAKCLDSNTPFYEREINPDIEYDAETNTFKFVFCNNGKCIPIAKNVTNLNYNAIPRKSFALAPFDNRLSLWNNEEGHNPLDCDSLKKITFNVTEQETAACEVEMATIKVGLIIHSVARGANQFIFTYDPWRNGSHDGITKYFGGIAKNRFQGVAAYDDAAPYKQFFEDKSEDAGFIVYVEGNDAAVAVTKQYIWNGAEFIARIPENMKNARRRDDVSEDIDKNRYFFMQLAEIKVVKGTKGVVRVAAQNTTKDNEHYRDTSANVYGKMFTIQGYHSNYNINQSNCDLLTKELYFDTCDGDVDLTQAPLIISDLAATDSHDNKDSTAFAGYFKDKQGRPIAGAEVVPFGYSGASWGSTITDHNGRYFVLGLFGYLAVHSTNTGADLYAEGADCKKEHAGTAFIGSGTRPNQVFENDVISDITDYDTNYYQTVQVKVVDEDGIPIPGIAIVIEGQKAKYTTSNGFASFVIRNNMARYGTAMSLRAMPMQNGICFLTTGDCDACAPIYTINFPACFDGPPAPIILTDAFPAFNSPALSKGWHPGGVYPLAIKLIEPTGNETFAEELATVTMPSIQQRNSYSFSILNWQVAAGVNFPPEYSHMAILIGKNRAFDDMVTWVVDKVEFVDSSGTAATSNSADKILLSIRSLYDAAAFNTGTNVKYQYTPGDKLEFIANGDGKIFNLPVGALTFNIEGDYNNRDAVLENDDDRYSKLVISYSRDLIDLTVGAQIKLIKISKCDNDQAFYETCALIPLVNGEPAITSGTVNGWDTYMVRRGIFYNSQNNQFNLPFLHHSPSDYWGDHCMDRGRVSFVNKFSKRLQYGRKMKPSDVWLDNGNVNGLGWYNSGEKNFDGEQRGDIICVISLEQILMVICEFDNFYTNKANDFIRIDPRTKQAIASNPDQVFADPQSKIVGNFGCQYHDVKSIVAGDGWVFWVDTYSKAPVLNDWDQVRNVCIDQTGRPRMTGYFVKRLQKMYKENKSLAPENKMFIAAGYDPVAKNILVTFFNPLQEEDKYQHSREDYDYDKNETIAFCWMDGTFPTMYSFTPEAYGLMPNSEEGNVFITFKNGLPYFHRVISSPDFNTFFGVACDMIITPVVNELKNKNKVFYVMQQWASQPFFVKRAFDSLGHETFVPPVDAQKLTEGKYDMFILCDKNSPGGIRGQVRMRGDWLTLVLVRDNSLNLAWNVVDEAKQKKYSELDTIIFKFGISEQSSYNTNN